MKSFLLAMAQQLEVRWPDSEGWRFYSQKNWGVKPLNGKQTRLNHHHSWYRFCLMPIDFLAPVSNCANCSSGEKSKGRVRKVQAVVHLRRYFEFVFNISMRCRWMFFISVYYCIRGLLLVSRWLREVAGRSCLVVGLRWSDPPPPLLSWLWSGSFER